MALPTVQRSSTPSLSTTLQISLGTSFSGVLGITIVTPAANVRMTNPKPVRCMKGGIHNVVNRCSLAIARSSSRLPKGLLVTGCRVAPSEFHRSDCSHRTAFGKPVVPPV